MDDGTFLVVSRGYLVNMGYIQASTEKNVSWRTERRSFSAGKPREIRQRYHDYLFERA